MPRVPNITMAYQMIRVLQKRKAPGDAEKITELQTLIEEDKDTRALIAVEKYFPTEQPLPLAKKK